MASLGIYKTYSFKDKDPIIDALRGPIKNKRYAEIAAKSGVSESTLYNWFNGATRRPQFASLKAVARALDCDIVLVKKDSLEIIK